METGERRRTAAGRVSRPFDAMHTKSRVYPPPLFTQTSPDPSIDSATEVHLSLSVATTSGGAKGLSSPECKPRKSHGTTAVTPYDHVLDQIGMSPRGTHFKK